MTSPKAGYRKAHDPIRSIAMRHNDNGSLSPWIEIMDLIFKKLQSDEAELAMHRAKEKGGTLRDCMDAALEAAFSDRA